MTIKLAAWQLVLAGLVIGVLGAGVVALALRGGGSSKSPAQVVANLTPTVVKQADVAPTPLPPTSTSVPPTQAPPPPPPTEPPVRTDCALIKATGYQSDAERNYYLANCTSSAPAATARPGTGQAPAPAPPSLIAPAPVALTPDEQRYKDQASAQLSYLNAQLSQFYNGNAQSYGATNAILQLCAIAGNLATTLDNLQPVPPRYRAVHDELRSSHAAFRTDCLTISNVSTLAQFNTWLIKFDADIDRMNGAIDDYDRVVGIQLANLRR